VRGQVDLHVKNSAEHIKDVQNLLHLRRARADEGDIISIHDVWDTEAIQDRACTWQLQPDHVMQQFYEQAKQQRAELTALLGASSGANGFP
jgi:hypothetical protein